MVRNGPKVKNGSRTPKIKNVDFDPLPEGVEGWNFVCILVNSISFDLVHKIPTASQNEIWPPKTPILSPRKGGQNLVGSEKFLRHSIKSKKIH